ncbi:MAG: extensin family protein [Aestuariivirga sp.]
MRLRLVCAVLIAVVCSSAIEHSARATTLLQGIEHNLKRIDRQLCSNMHSAKCKPVKTKSVRVHKSKPVPAAPVIVPLKVAPVAPVKAVPVAPVAPATVPRLAPPLPKLRPADLNSDKTLLPDARVIGHKASPAIPPTPVAKPSSPVVVPVTPLPPPVAVAPVTPPVSPPAADQGSACLAALAATGTSFAPVPQPETSLACQVDTPVHLNSLATKAGVVKLPDQPIFNCAFALKLSQFVDQRMQPLAQQSVGSAIVAMGTGPGFNCRGRNGDSASKMSEHAIGNAVDIENIKLANKTQIQVKDALNVQSPSFAFLRDVRASACTEFTTVLGPGANSAHAEHFHLDLEVRRGGYRLCE